MGRSHACEGGRERLRNGPLKDSHALIPGACVTADGQKMGLCRYEEVKDLGTGRLPWIVQVGPKCHVSVHKRESEGDWTDTEEKAT